MTEDFSCMRYLSGPGFASADTVPKFLPDTNFVTEHVKLDVVVDLENFLLSGWCHTTVRIVGEEVASIAFNAVCMKIDEILVKPHNIEKSRKASWKVKDNILTILLPQKSKFGNMLTISVRYSVKDPQAGIFFIRPTKDYPDRPYQVWTQGQSDDARCWFPCRDIPSEKATGEMIATVPYGYTAISNGKLVERKSDKAKKFTTFNWKMEQRHSLYLFSLVVGIFDEYKAAYGKVPIVYYADPKRIEDAKRGFKATPAAMDFFIKETGVDYPYERYAQVAAVNFSGGMENTSVTTQTDRALIDERAAIDMDFDSLVSHELAHQWFGDLVTCKDWSNAWLHESFATYYQALFYLHDRGLDDFRLSCRQMADVYFHEAREEYRRPIVTRVWRESFQLFDSHLYQKGACVLHFLRSLIGPEAWRRAVKHYLDKHRFSTAETKDLIEAIYTETGVNFEAQFEQWIYRSGHPEFKMVYSWNSGKKEACIYICQQQAVNDAKNLFEIPISIGFSFPRGRKTFKLNLTKPEHNFSIKLPSAPLNCILDPDSELFLKKVETIKPAAMWKAQLVDENILSRVEAVDEISGWKAPEAATLLEKAFAVEKFWWGRGRIAKALGKMRIPEATNILLKYAKDKHPKVRRAIIEALGELKQTELAPLFIETFHHDESIFVASHALTALAATHDTKARRLVTEALNIDSWDESIRTAAVNASAELGCEVKTMEGFLKPGIPRQLKVAALMNLSRLGRGDQLLRKKIETMIDDKNQIVSYTAVKALAKLGDPLSVPGLRRRLSSATNSIFRSILDDAIRSLRSGKTDDPPKPTPISSDT